MNEKNWEKIRSILSIYPFLIQPHSMSENFLPFFTIETIISISMIGTIRLSIISTFTHFHFTKKNERKTPMFTSLCELEFMVPMLSDVFYVRK